MADGEVPESEMNEMIDESYGLVVGALPKRIRAALTD